VCHQSVGLIARALEASGIPTVSLTSALTITTNVGVPRAVYVDYPLGRTAGKPGDRADQRSIIEGALNAFATHTAPGQVTRLPNRWSEDDSWKDRAQRIGWSGDGLHATEGDERKDRSDEPQWHHPADAAAVRSATCPEKSSDLA
jgi:hypothetical protein